MKIMNFVRIEIKTPTRGGEGRSAVRPKCSLGQEAALPGGSLSPSQVGSSGSG